MRINLGRVDQVIRIVAGLALIAFAILDQTPFRWVGLAGIALLLTGFVRFCPAYWLLRIKTIGRCADSVVR